MLDTIILSPHHITSDMCPTATSLAILTMCMMSVESNPSPPSPPSRRDARLQSEFRRITDLQLLHPMPIIPALDRGSPDESFSNIPSEAFTLDSDSFGSKRTFKKDLSLDVLPPEVSPSTLVAGDIAEPFVLLLNQQGEEGSDETLAAGGKARNDSDGALEWFTSDDIVGLEDGAGAGAGADSYTPIASNLPTSTNTQTSSVADEWNMVWKLMQNPYLNSIHYEQDREPQQMEDRIKYDLYTKQLRTLQPQREPMTPFVNRGSTTQMKELPHSNTLEHYGFVKEHHDTPRHYTLNKKHYDTNMANFGSDNVYYGLHKHRGSNRVHYGPHKHYESNVDHRGSNKERYDSNKQHYYGSNKIHYDSNNQDNNGLNKGSYDPNKEYYGLHKHYGSNKEYYGSHKHHGSNDEHYGSTKDQYDSSTDKYGWNNEQLLPRVKLAVLKEANDKNSVKVEDMDRMKSAAALFRALYLDPIKAIFCAGQVSLGACGDDSVQQYELAHQAGGGGAGRLVGGRRKQSWLVLGDGKDQRLNQYIIKENGQPFFIV